MTARSSYEGNAEGVAPISCYSAILTPVPQYNGNAENGEDDDRMVKENVF